MIEQADSVVARMNRRVAPLTFGSLLVALASGCTDPTGPGSDPFCSTRSPLAIVAFEDANLESAIRATLSVGSEVELTCGLLQTVTTLNAGHLEIVSMAGIENLTDLMFLWIRGNSITDITPLSGLTELTFLNLAANSLTDVSALSGLMNLMFLAINDNGTIVDISALRGLTSLTGTLWMGGNSITDLNAVSGLTNLTAINAWENSITDISGVSGLTDLTNLNIQDNSITDLSPLSGLTNLTGLRVHENSITDLSTLSGLTALSVLKLQDNPDLSDIQPLFDNTGFGPGDIVWLGGTKVTCTDMEALGAKGVTVIADCP